MKKNIQQHTITDPWSPMEMIKARERTKNNMQNIVKSKNNTTIGGAISGFWM